MHTPYAARREKVRRVMYTRGIDALLVSHAANRYYLSGFELHDPQFNESAGRLIITADGRDWLLTDARYRDAALRLWDANRVFIYGADAPAQMRRLLRQCGSRVGIEARGVSWHFVRELASSGSGLWLEAVDGLVENLRCIKEPEEIAALKKSFALNHDLLHHVEEQLEPGRTEADISWAIERYFREHGASELAFPSIVAVGRNAALPHAVPGRDRVMENTPVLVDVGCRLDDYCSDQTRTFWVGPVPTADFRRSLDLTRQAQQAAMQGMHPGVPLAEVYAMAYKIFETAGVAQAFTHGLGHGVGLETHELPTLSPRSRGVLMPGMVVTVEPGLYYPEWGGVRWEHTVLVEENGVCVL
ncbi:MAG: aminopeptidase P family protein [Desulfovibrio sp.]|nr:aminopeptidase P family protein [Desulfovibrio sp.]